MKINEQIYFRKNRFSSKMRSGHFFDAWIRTGSKNWPLHVKYEPVGPYGDPFRETIVHFFLFFDKNQTAPKKTQDYIPDSLPKKRQKLIKSITVSFFWRLDPTFSSPFSSHKYPERMHQRRLICLFPVQHKTKHHRFFVSFFVVSLFPVHGIYIEISIHTMDIRGIKRDLYMYHGYPWYI